MTDLIPSRTPAESSIRTGDPRKWWVLFSVAFGAFMAPLDASIVNTVLPLIAGEFRADVLLIEWVVLTYLLSLSSLLLIGGRLGDLFSDKSLYIVGFALFTLSSMLCGLATGVWSLVASRVLQAVGGARGEIRFRRRRLLHVDVVHRGAGPFPRGGLGLDFGRRPDRLSHRDSHRHSVPLERTAQPPSLL
jgi:MFS family permease